MAYTNSTAHYQLPQYVGSDIPSILTDVNGAYQRIDTAINDVAVSTGQAVQDLSSVTSRVGQVESGLTSLDGVVSTVSGRVTTVENGLTSLEGVVSTVSGKVTTNESNINTVQTNLNDIQGVIPSNASANNMLVTANDVEPKIANLPDYNRYYLNTYNATTSDTVGSALLKALRALSSAEGVGIKRNIANLSVQLGGFYASSTANYYTTLRASDFSTSTITLAGIATTQENITIAPKIIVAKIVTSSSSFNFDDLTVSDIYEYSLNGSGQSIASDAILEDYWGVSQIWRVG